MRGYPVGSEYTCYAMAHTHTTRKPRKICKRPRSRRPHLYYHTQTTRFSTHSRVRSPLDQRNIVAFASSPIHGSCAAKKQSRVHDLIVNLSCGATAAVAARSSLIARVRDGLIRSRL